MSGAKLPPCPVCGEEPFWVPPVSRGSFFFDGSLSCRMREEGHTTHEITVYAATLQGAESLWRRVAGGRK